MSAYSPVVTSLLNNQEFMDQLPPPFKRALEMLQTPAISIPIFGTLNAGTHALAAGLFTAISPLGGAIFGISSFATNQIVTLLSDKFNCYPAGLIFAVAKVVLPIIAGFAAGYAALYAVGLPVTIPAALAIAIGGYAFGAAVIVTAVVTAGVGIIAYKVYEAAQQHLNQSNVELHGIPV